jgi:hypothetical protein
LRIADLVLLCAPSNGKKPVGAGGLDSFDHPDGHRDHHGEVSIVIPEGTWRQKEQHDRRPRWSVILAAVSAGANVVRLMRELLIHH